MALHQLVNCVFDLRRKVAKNEIVISHDFIHLLCRQLKLERKIVFDWSHLAQLQKLVDL